MKEQEIKDWVLQQIQDVLDGKLDEYQSNISVGVEDISSYLCDIGFEEENFDSNGWQYDYWLEFTHKELGKYTLAGSGYYGTQSFTKDE